MSANKHENCEILNLIRYGPAKFDTNFVKQFGYQTKNIFISKWLCEKAEKDFRRFNLIIKPGKVDFTFEV